MTSPPETQVEELLKALDKISEHNKLRGRGHGELDDTCYICGISPSTLKSLISDITTEADSMNQISNMVAQHGEVDFVWNGKTYHIKELKAQPLNKRNDV